ncbi:MAG TPA: HEAT repeat domain-containing protein [Gemmatimonadales bacterium]|jgi:hypothetical protein
MPKSPAPTASLPELFGHLILLLRGTPGREDRILKALDLVVARVADSPALIEAGIENNWAQGGDPLKERLQIRQVDAIRIAAGAPPHEILALARALADDLAPIPSTTQVQVTVLPDVPEPQGPPSLMRPSDPRMPSVSRDRSDERLAQVVDGVLRELEQAAAEEQWHTVLHNAQAALRMMPGLGESAQRVYTIGLRRLLTRPVLEALIDQGYRVPEEQARTAEVLRAGGLPAAELMIDTLNRSDTIGPRAFLVDSLGGMPDALPLIAHLARSRRPSEARLAAEVLGRLGMADAVPLLSSLVQHPDDKVRLAAVDSLGRYRDKSAVEPLRQALGHTSAAIRARAGRALAARGSGAIAMPLLAALEAERDPLAWEELLGALAAIDAPEAAAALSRIALARRGFLGLGGAALRRQLAVVRTLAAAKTGAARQALSRIAAEGEGEVREAAAVALGSE